MRVFIIAVTNVIIKQVKTDLNRHNEAKHCGGNYSCEKCSHKVSTQGKLKDILKLNMKG